jgi:hypothetical protein
VRRFRRRRSGQWLWEIEYFHGDGCAGFGAAASRAEAMVAADTAIELADGA